MEIIKRILVVSRMIPYSRKTIKYGIFLDHKHDRNSICFLTSTNLPPGEECTVECSSSTQRGEAGRGKMVRLQQFVPSPP